jgi:hypothetical protein
MVTMHTDLKILLVVAFVAAVIGVLIIRAARAARRRQAIYAWCRANGLQFDPARSDDPGAEFSQVEVMQEGAKRYGENWCMGRWQGRQLCYFDYHYIPGPELKGVKVSQDVSIMTIESPTPLKPLTIRPEGLLDKVGDFFGAQAIHFESEEFNRKFHVTCEDRKWAYDALPPRAMELLLSSPRELCIQFDDRALVIWDGALWPVEDIEQAARIAAGLLNLMPKFAAQEAME